MSYLVSLRLSSEKGSFLGFDAQSDLFSRPRAIAIIRVDGIDSLNSKDHSTYELENVCLIFIWNFLLLFYRLICSKAVLGSLEYLSFGEDLHQQS